jgi:hypothetical protein
MTSTQVKLFRVIRWSRFVISFLTDLRRVAFLGPLQGSLSAWPFDVHHHLLLEIRSVVWFT